MKMKNEKFVYLLLTHFWYYFVTASLSLVGAPGHCRIVVMMSIWNLLECSWKLRIFFILVLEAISRICETAKNEG